MEKIGGSSSRSGRTVVVDQPSRGKGRSRLRPDAANAVGIGHKQHEGSLGLRQRSTLPGKRLSFSEIIFYALRNPGVFAWLFFLGFGQPWAPPRRREVERGTKSLLPESASSSFPPPRLASGRAGFQARIAGAGRVTASPSRFAGRPPVARAVPGAASGGARGDILLAFWIALPLGRGE